jgi:Ca-activated chloride channel homolog
MDDLMMPLAGVFWARPYALLLLLVPLLWLRLPRHRPALHLATANTFERIGQGGAWPRVVGWFSRVLVVGSWLLAVVVIAGPFSSVRPPVQRSGIDLIIALDLSSSMNALDLAPGDPRKGMFDAEALANTRIAHARRVVDRFVEKRPRDRIGLVVFSGDAFAQVPLTFDHTYIRKLLNKLRPGVLADGTAIGNAVIAGVARLADSQAERRVVVLITDGKNTAGNVEPLDAARVAAEAEVAVFTVLIGREQAVVPFYAGPGRGGNAQIALSQMETDPRLLAKIAERTGGKAFRAVDKAGLERGFHSILDDLQRSELRDETQAAERRPLAPDVLPLLGVMLLLAAGLRSAVPERA